MLYKGALNCKILFRNYDSQSEIREFHLFTLCIAL